MDKKKNINSIRENIGGKAYQTQIPMPPSKITEVEIPISSSYPGIDTDLARDNIENDLTSSDLQDLYNSDGRHE